MAYSMLQITADARFHSAVENQRMSGTLRAILQKFPASLLLLILLIVSMWANKRYTDEIEDLCAAGGILYEEGTVAWEGLGDLAPDNLERDEKRWRWAQAQFRSRCKEATQ